MEIGFNQIEEMTVGDLVKIHADKERIEKEGGFFLRVCNVKARELNQKEEFDLDSFLENC